MPYTPSTDHHNTPAQPQTAQTSSHNAATSRCRGAPAAECHRPVPSGPPKPLPEAGPRRTSLPAGVIPGEPAARQQPAGGLSDVANAPAACRSTAPARPVVQQPLLDQKVTLCRLAAAAARRSAAAACIEWCLHTTRPAAPEGRGSSSPGRMPKERPPGRSGRGRERAARMSSCMKTKTNQKKR